MQMTENTYSPWATELDDLIRGASGGFLFGIPLLYTMEVWWIGSFTTPLRMLAILGATFLVVFLLTHTAGFRRANDTGFIRSLQDAVEALAIGIVCATGVLLLLSQITAQTPLDEALGKIVFESVPFSLGVALARQFLSGARGENRVSDQQESTTQDKGNLNETLTDVGATLIGATIIAFNIAPTDEVPMLSAAVTGPWLILVIAASLIISYGIVFEAGFADQHQREQQRGIFQRPLSETVMAYLVSLTAALLMLWFFQQLSFSDPWQMWLSYTIILGLPATIGGAAGRLAV
jgi:putative integral membrane protein (TIGR02587 family)